MSESQASVEMTESRLLTICILVRDQESDVSRILSRIPQTKYSDIQVIVRDGGKNNKNKPYIKDLLDKGLIEYAHHPDEPIDQKIINSIKFAEGKFVWLFGDDDLAKDAINKVLSIIKLYEDLSFIWANFELLDSKKLAADLKVDRFFNSRDEILGAIGLGIGFISSSIFRRSYALKALDHAEDYLGTGFIGLYITLRVIAEQSGYFYIHGPIVICHPRSGEDMKKIILHQNNRTNNKCFEAFGVNFVRIITQFRGSFSKNTIATISSCAFNQAWKGVFVGWMGGWDSPSGNRKLILRNFWHFPSSWLALFIFSLPHGLNNYLYQIYKKIKK